MEDDDEGEEGARRVSYADERTKVGRSTSYFFACVFDRSRRGYQPNLPPYYN